MKGLEIYLKSGAVVIVDATELSTKRNVVTGELTSIAWTTPEGGKRKLFSVEPSEVAALVVLR